jgi:hypothetical protein
MAASAIYRNAKLQWNKIMNTENEQAATSTVENKKKHMAR